MGKLLRIFKYSCNINSSISIEWQTLFAFEPWHSAVELKRYTHRFIQEMPKLYDLSGVRRTPYNQYDSMLLPMTKWLKSQGVNFELGCEVTDIEFKPSKTETTVTLKDPTMFNKIIEFTGNQPGTGAHMTFRDSVWLFSLVLHNQPHFLNQPDNIQVFWGYTLYPYKKGDFVKKPMVDCTGEEILTEILYHLNFKDDMDKILKTSICKPCIMPFTTAQFLKFVYKIILCGSPLFVFKNGTSVYV